MERGSFVKRIRFEDYVKAGKLNCIKRNYIRNWGRGISADEVPCQQEGTCQTSPDVFVVPATDQNNWKSSQKSSFAGPLGFFSQSPISSSTLYLLSSITLKCATILKQLVFLFALLEQGWIKKEWRLEWEQGLLPVLWVTFLVKESMNTHKVLFCCTGWPSLISVASSHSCLPFSMAIFLFYV